MLRKTLMTMMLVLMMTLNIESARAAIVLSDNPVAVVMPYLDKSTKSSELVLRDATLVSEYLIEELMKDGRLQIPAREHMQEILNEHKINESGLVNPSTAISIGNWVGARYMIVGSVVGLSAKKSGIDGGGTFGRDVGKNSSRQGVTFDGSKYTVIANITLRIIDLETGLYVLATHGEGKSARTRFDFSLSKDVVNYFGEDGETPPQQETPSDDSGSNQTQQTPSDDSGNSQQQETPNDDSGNNQQQETPNDDSGNNQQQETPSDDSGNSQQQETPSDDSGNNQQQETPSGDSGNNQADIPMDGSNDESSSYTPSTDGENQNTGNDDIDVDENGNPIGEKSVGTFEDIEFIPLVFYFDEGEGGTYSTRTINVKFGMGSRGFGAEQVHNALKKAIEDAVNNKNYGLIAKLNGTAKKRKN